MYLVWHFVCGIRFHLVELFFDSNKYRNIYIRKDYTSLQSASYYSFLRVLKKNPPWNCKGKDKMHIIAHNLISIRGVRHTLSIIKWDLAMPYTNVHRKDDQMWFRQTKNPCTRATLGSCSFLITCQLQVVYTVQWIHRFKKLTLIFATAKTYNCITVTHNCPNSLPCFRWVNIESIFQISVKFLRCFCTALHEGIKTTKQKKGD